MEERNIEMGERMLVRNNISYLNKNIILETNDFELYEEFKSEYEDYFQLTNIKNNRKFIKLKVLKSKEIHTKYFDLVRKNRNKISKVYINVRRENIVVVDKSNNEVCVIYDQYTDEKLQYVGEIVCSIFGEMLEEEGFFFMNSICASKGKEGILIICRKNIEETKLLLELLQNGFRIISKAQIGIKNNEGVAIPIRIGIKSVEIEKSIVNEKYIEKIKETKGYRAYLKEKSQTSKDPQKFNITMKELNKIFEIKALSKVKIKLILDLHQTLGTNKFQINKMEKEELIELFIENRREGVYKPVKYLEKLFDGKQKENFLSKIQKETNIYGYKIFQKKVDINKIINFINIKIK